MIAGIMGRIGPFAGALLVWLTGVIRNDSLEETIMRTNMKTTLLAALLLLLTTAQAAAPGLRVGGRTIGDAAHIADIKKLGFDFAEISLHKVTPLTDEQFAQLRAEVKKINLPVLVGAYILASEVPTVGPQIDPAKQLESARLHLGRAQQLGVKLVTFGGVRVPPGFTREKSFKQMIGFVRRIAPEAKRHGITLAVQPVINDGKALVNTVAGALRVVEGAKQPNFGICFELYHMLQVKEGPDAIRQAGKHLKHVKISNPARDLPLDPKEYDYAAFFTALGEIGYDGTVSIYSAPSGPDAVTKPAFLERAPQSLAFVRQMAAQYVNPTRAKRAAR